ncbi:MAG TPA: tetratricopeptide repeat protein [Polyangia bacterium]
MIVVVICLGAGVGGSARAEDAAAAREHYERGTKFYDIGKYDDAIHEFEAAYEAKSDPAFIYNLAQSHRLAGHNTEALQLYRNYLRNSPHAPNRADIEERIRALEKTIAEHPASNAPAVTPAAAPPETPAVVGAPPAQTPPPAAGPTLGPGTGEANPAPGPPGPPYPNAYPPPGQPEANALPPAYPPMPAATPPAHSGRKTAGIVIASVGGVFLVGGAIGGLIAKSESNKVQDAAKTRGKFDPSAESTGRAAELFQWIGYGVGAAGIALGLILYATVPSTPSEAAPPRVAVAPLAGPGLGGALVRMTF